MTHRIGDKVTIIWNTEELPMEYANGHYPNEKETVTVLSEDEECYHCTNSVWVSKKHEDDYVWENEDVSSNI